MSAAKKNGSTPAPLRPGARSAPNPAPESGNGKNVAPRPGNRRNFNLEPARRQRWNAARVHKVKFAAALWSGLPQKAAAVQAGYQDGAGLEATASRLTRDPIVIAELERLAGEERERAHRARAKRTGYAQGEQAQTSGAADPAGAPSFAKVNSAGRAPALLGAAGEAPASIRKSPAPRIGKVNGEGHAELSGAADDAGAFWDEVVEAAHRRAQRGA